MEPSENNELGIIREKKSQAPLAVAAIVVVVVMVSGLYIWFLQQSPATDSAELARLQKEATALHERSLDLEARYAAFEVKLGIVREANPVLDTAFEEFAE